MSASITERQLGASSIEDSQADDAHNQEPLTASAAPRQHLRSEPSREFIYKTHDRILIQVIILRLSMPTIVCVCV